MFLPRWRLGILIPTYREVLRVQRHSLHLWGMSLCHALLSLKLPHQCPIPIPPLVAPLGFYLVYFHFASCLNLTGERFVAFPAGWNRDTRCSFRWAGCCLSSRELSCHTGLSRAQNPDSFTHLPGCISHRYFLHLGIFCPFFWLAPRV